MLRRHADVRRDDRGDRGRHRRRSRVMRILTILARMGVDAYPDAEAALHARLDRQLPQVERETIVVDNALAPEVIERTPGRTLIGGDNSAWEFSAFDRAVAYA